MNPEAAVVDSSVDEATSSEGPRVEEGVVEQSDQGVVFDAWRDVADGCPQYTVY